MTRKRTAAEVDEALVAATELLDDEEGNEEVERGGREGTTLVKG
jgi:hypothetical protein